LIARQEHFTFQSEKPSIYASCPFMPVLWFLDFLFKMKDNALFVFFKETCTFFNRRHVWRATCGFPISNAAKRTFHPHPLRNHDIFRVNPLEILKLMFQEKGFKLLLSTHLCQLNQSYWLVVEISFHFLDASRFSRPLYLSSWDDDFRWVEDLPACSSCSSENLEIALLERVPLFTTWWGF